MVQEQQYCECGSNLAIEGREISNREAYAMSNYYTSVTPPIVWAISSVADTG